MKKVDLIFLAVDDWQMLYVDGVLECENHRLSDEFLEVIDTYKNFNSVKSCWIEDYEWFEENAKKIENFSDIPEDKIQWD